MARLRIWYAKNRSPKETWVVQTENGISTVIENLEVTVPCFFMPAVPSTEPKAWAECEGSLILESGNWRIVA